MTELGYHAPLVVRDADAPFTVSPVGAPSTGGQPVQIFVEPWLQLPLSVYFDTTPVNFQTIGDSVVFTPPPHPPGTVDVTLLYDPTHTVTAKAAFTYFDPAAPPDPFVFEPVLFPVAYNGPGLFGSSWKTELADWAHLSAACLWIGGLVQLAVDAGQVCHCRSSGLTD